MANTSAVAERVAAAHSLWLSSLPTIKRAPTGDLLPALLDEVGLEPITAPIVNAAGSVAATHGPVSDMAVSPDGRRLVVAHYGADAVSIIDTATMTVTATVSGIAEPYSVVIADRAYVTSASTEEDAIVAVDTATAVPFAAKNLEMAARGLAVSPAGDTLYVARIGDDRADVAVIDVESGALRAIAVSPVSAASVEAVQLGADGTRLFVALTTTSGGSLVVIDTTRCVVLGTVALGGSIGEIAAHPNGRKIFATGWDAELGSVINVIDVVGARVIDTIGVRGIPTSLVLGHDGDLAYFVDRDQIAVMCTATHEIIDHIAVGGALACLAAGPQGRLYAADYSGAITALQLGSTSDLALLAS